MLQSPLLLPPSPPTPPSPVRSRPRRENNTGGFPRGLNQFFRALRYWLYGASPFEPMQWEGPLEDLKQALAEGEDVFGEGFAAP